VILGKFCLSASRAEHLWPKKQTAIGPKAKNNDWLWARIDSASEGDRLRVPVRLPFKRDGLSNFESRWPLAQSF